MGLLQGAFLPAPRTGPFHPVLCSGIVAAFLVPPTQPYASPAYVPWAEPLATKLLSGPCTETLPPKCTKEQRTPNILNSRELYV